MATFTSTQAASTYFAAGHGAGNDVKFATGSYAITAALAAADIIQMCKVPAGATVLDVHAVVPDLDTHGTPTITLHIGYGGDNDYWVSGSTTGQTGGVIRATATTSVPLAFTAEDTIDITVGTGPATGATSGTLYLTVFYSMP